MTAMFGLREEALNYVWTNLVYIQDTRNPRYYLCYKSKVISYLAVLPGTCWSMFMRTHFHSYNFFISTSFRGILSL